MAHRLYMRHPHEETEGTLSPEFDGVYTNTECPQILLSFSAQRAPDVPHVY